MRAYVNRSGLKKQSETRTLNFSQAKAQARLIIMFPNVKYDITPKVKLYPIRIWQMQLKYLLEFLPGWNIEFY